jgi:hypothetical protein
MPTGIRVRRVPIHLESNWLLESPRQRRGKPAADYDVPSATKR